jgi:carbon-monoxide dehydrogenase iron sulfur subunit
MARALKGVRINPKIRIEEKEDICFAVSCRHCEVPLCTKGCITGALSVKNGVIMIDKDKCVGCYTCILCCPFGAISPSEYGAIEKCELCVRYFTSEPMCVKGCPNGAIVFETR